MRRIPGWWSNEFLARLGLVRRKKWGEAKHRKSRRLNMESLEARQYLTGIPPTIGSLTANLATVTRPDDFVLTANTVQDSDGTVQSVAFYRDSNGNAQLDVGTDELLGTDTSSDGGWTATVDTANFPAGAQTYFARATDNESLTSSPVWAANTVQGPFLIGAASVNEGSTYTLGLDPGGVSITGWSINWGDGGDAESVSGSAHSATHVYTDGTNNFSITATANSGTYTTNTVAVAVQNVAPYLSISGAASVNEGSSYTLNLSSSDPGADTIDHWTINWGDGGSPETVSGNPSSVTHTYTDNAVRTVTATATDEDGTFSLGGTAGALDPVFGDGGKVTTNIAESGGGSETGKSVAIQSNGKIVMAGEGYLARYNTDGSLDSTFGVDGKLATGANAMALVLQSDDKILVASGKTVGQETTCHLARYFSDGTFDPSFGTGREIVLDFSPNALAVQSDGEILVAGYKTISTNDFVLTRYHSNGNLDAAFGTHGQVTTDFAGRSDYATAITVQSNGRIVVAGYSRSGSNNDFALARYTTDGGLDTTFGTGGKVTTDFAGRNDYGYALGLQSDGKIVVGGYVYNGSNFDFALARYTTDGGLDTTFGTGGKVTTNFAGRNDYGYALGLQSDGKIVVGGYVFNGSNNDFALARYSTSGSLDTTFGTGGKVTTNIASQDNPAYSLAIQSDDKIVVGGYVGSTAAYDFALARYTAAGGSLDTSFDTDGIVTTDLGGSEDSARDVVVQSDGKVVLAGYVFNGSDYDFALTRYNTDGSLDTTFDGDGKVITDFGGSDYARSLAIQADGKIVVAGSSGSSFALARYNTDGSLDTTFDGDGKLTTAFASSAGGNTVAIQTDGKILVGGAAESSFALARYNTDGSLDTTFDGDGKVTTAFTNGAVGTAVAIQSDGKIVLAGHAADTTVRFGVARYNTDGSLDTTFGTGGKVTTGFEGSYADAAYMVAVQADGRIVVGGTTWFFGMDFSCYSDFAMARFNADGSLDSTFDGDGKLVTDIRVIDEAKAAVIQRDGKIVVVGYSELDPDPEPPPVFDVVRYNVDGSLDTTFAGEGLRVADLEGSCYSVALAPDGRIVVAGESQQDFAAIRYLPGVVPLAATVNNVAPTATITGVPANNQSLEGTQISLGSTVTDPSSADTTAGFTYAWDVTKVHGATTTEHFATGTDDDFSFTPDDDGTYTVTLVATDKDGGVSATSQSQVLVGDFLASLDSSGNLLVLGGGGNEDLSVQASVPNIQLTGSSGIIVTAINGASGSGTATVTIPLSALGSQGRVIFNGNGTGGSHSFTYNLAGGPLGHTVVVASATNVTVNENVSTQQTIIIERDTTDPTKTNVASTAGGLVSLANPLGMLSVNGGAGMNTVNVSSLGVGFDAALTLNAASTGASVINFNASLSPAVNHGLSLSSDTINVASGAAIALSGTGAASLTTTRNVAFAPATRLTVVDGDLTISASPTTLSPTDINAEFIGIDLNGATIQTSGTGNIILTGKSGPAGTATDNPGILLRGGTDLASTSFLPGAAGSITITGIETTTSTNAGAGIRITDATTTITSEYGNILLSGTSGIGADGKGSTAGVHLTNSAMISSTGTGAFAATITINGTAGDNYQTAVGIQLGEFRDPRPPAWIKTKDGNITITAAGAQNSGPGHRSFVMYESTAIESTGTGSINIVGNSTFGTENNRNGVDMRGSIECQGTGSITLDGVWGSNNSGSGGICLVGSVTTNNRPITLIGDGMVISGTVNAGSGTVTILPKTATKPIKLGDADSYDETANEGNLGLTQAELANIAGGMIQIGNTASGNVTVSDTVTLPEDTNVSITTGGNDRVRCRQVAEHCRPPHCNHRQRRLNDQ